MKHFAIKLGVFIGILFIILAIFSVALKVGQKHYDSYGSYKLKKLLEDKSTDPEIIVFGSSVAEGAFDPKIISTITQKSTFNAALSGRRIIDWSSVAFSFVGYTKNAKVIILDVFPNAFNETDQLYNPHEFYPYLSNRFVRQALAPVSTTYKKMTQLPFYYLTQLNSTILINSTESIKNLLLKKPSNIDADYMGYKNVNTPYEAGKLSNVIKPEISKRSISLYEELFSKANEKNIKVILVGMPVYVAGKAHYQNIDSLYQWGNHWALAHPNVEFVNFLYDSSFVTQSNFFANNTHLNASGATVISTQVAEYLNKSGYYYNK